MTEAIIVAIIAAIASVAGQWMISRRQSKDRREEDIEREVRLDERLKRVEEKLDEHNGYAARFESIGLDIAVIKSDIKTLYKAKGEA